MSALDSLRQTVFSILGADVQGDLLLLDPFSDFLPRRTVEVIPKIARASTRIVVVLFVLNLNPENPVGQQYRQLRSQHLSAAWLLNCPKLPHAGVEGESHYEVDVLLAWRALAEHPARNELRNRIDTYAQFLSGVLDTKITFTAP